MLKTAFTKVLLGSALCILLPGCAPVALASTVHQIKVLPDKVADASSLKSIVESVTRGAKTNDEKAIALYNFDVLCNYHRAYPSEPSGVEALKQFNVYGWSLCGGLHSGLGALYRAMGWEWRFVGWSNPGHTTIEAKYDGQWHYLDTFLKFYVWKKDPRAPGGRTIAGQEDIKKNPALVKDLVFDKSRKVYYAKDNRFEIINGKANWLAPALLVCGDDASGVLTGVKSNSLAGSPTSWEGINFDGPYSTDVNLGPGYSLTLNWSAQPNSFWWNGGKEAPSHTCGDKDYRNSPVLGPIMEPYIAVGGGTRSYANGTLMFAPDLAHSAFLAGLESKENVKWEPGRLTPVNAGQPASITVRLQSPYVMTQAKGLATGADAVKISTDSGKTWKDIQIKDFSTEVGGQYDALVKISFRAALTALKLEATVQHNRAAAPYLSPGRNKVTVTAEDGKALGDNRLVVTYAYETGYRSKSYEQISEQDGTIGQAISATWTTTPTVVQKVFSAKDLPATLTIDVPTPKGKYPVYPRMLFMRREIVSEGAKPLALPEGAVVPHTRPTDELKELPDPFLIGDALPPVKVARPLQTRKILLNASHVISMKGDIAGLNQELRWYKDNHDAWVLMVGGEIKDLPQPRDIAEARLVLPVNFGHEKAPSRLDIVPLMESYDPQKAYNFKGFGEAIGTVTIDQQPAGIAAYSPPKEFRADITRYIKTLAAGEAKFQGCAVRVVPDRSIDDGWTVKTQFAKDAPIYIEIDVYADKPGAK